MLTLDPGDGQAAPPVQLERVRPRSVITLVASILAVYLLTSELARVNLGTLLRTADPRWILVALAFSALTYAGAAWQLSGFVLERLRLHPDRSWPSSPARSSRWSPRRRSAAPRSTSATCRSARYRPRTRGPASARPRSWRSSLHIVLLVIFVAITGGAQQLAAPAQLGVLGRWPGWPCWC